MTKSMLDLLGLTVLVGIALACTNPVTGRTEAGQVEIRVANQSPGDFERVTVTFPSSKVDYGRVQKGAATEYRQVGQAYRLAQIEVLTNGRTLTLQPQDYVGESPLAPGRYTYALKLDEISGELRLDLIDD
jgi:hypothetical protein